MAKRKPKIEILPSTNGKDYFFHLIAGNHTNQGDGQLYPTPSAALRGAKAWRKNAAEAEIIPYKKPSNA